MALISCPECKQKVSNQANICLHCGYRLNSAVGKFLKKLFKPIFYKAIPKDIVQIDNLNLLLSFKGRKYTYYSPRIFRLYPGIDTKAEFTTFNGDLSIINFKMLSNEFAQEFRNKKTKGEKLTYATDTIYKYAYQDKKIINKGIFNNGCWEGAILESADDNGRIAIVVFTIDINIIFLTTVVPIEAPENLYYENMQLLKSAHLPEGWKEKYKFYEKGS